MGIKASSKTLPIEKAAVLVSSRTEVKKHWKKVWPGGYLFQWPCIARINARTRQSGRGQLLISYGLRQTYPAADSTPLGGSLLTGGALWGTWGVKNPVVWDQHGACGRIDMGGRVSIPVALPPPY